MSDLTELVKEYLGNGGFFNPELMDHEKVRDMVIRLRDELDVLRHKLVAEKAIRQAHVDEIVEVRADNERLCEIIKEAYEYGAGDPPLTFEAWLERNGYRLQALKGVDDER